MAQQKEILDSSDKKVCNKCGVPKFLDEFHKSRGGKGGRGATCAVCQNKINEPLLEKRRQAAKERRDAGVRLKRPNHYDSPNPDIQIIRNIGIGQVPLSYWDLIKR